MSQTDIDATPNATSNATSTATAGAKKKVLILGEADFSFTANYIKTLLDQDQHNQIISTEYRPKEELLGYENFEPHTKTIDKAKLDNANLDIQIKYGVDATKLHEDERFKDQKFDQIHFNFPYGDGHDAKSNLWILVRDFFKSASQLQNSGSFIHMALPGKPNGKNYNGMDHWSQFYKFHLAAAAGNYIIYEKKSNFEKRYSEYSHRRTRLKRDNLNFGSIDEYIFEKVDDVEDTPCQILASDKFWENSFCKIKSKITSLQHLHFQASKANYKLGCCYADNGENELAKRYLEKALEVQDDDLCNYPPAKSRLMMLDHVADLEAFCSHFEMRKPSKDNYHTDLLVLTWKAFDDHYPQDLEGHIIKSFKESGLSFSPELTDAIFPLLDLEKSRNHFNFLSRLSSFNIENNRWEFLTPILKMIVYWKSKYPEFSSLQPRLYSLTGLPVDWYEFSIAHDLGHLANVYLNFHHYPHVPSAEIFDYITNKINEGLFSAMTSLEVRNLNLVSPGDSESCTAFIQVLADRRIHLSSLNVYFIDDQIKVFLTQLFLEQLKVPDFGSQFESFFIYGFVDWKAEEKGPSLAEMLQEKLDQFEPRISRKARTRTNNSGISRNH